MQIRIEVDVKPEELRRFLGLPDVAGLQEDVIRFLRDKLGAAGENFDPASFVKDNLQFVTRSSAWHKLMSAAKATAGSRGPAKAEAEPAAPAAGPPPAKRASRKRAEPRRSKTQPAS
jgi:hypothetical protein